MGLRGGVQEMEGGIGVSGAVDSLQGRGAEELPEGDERGQKLPRCLLAQPLRLEEPLCAVPELRRRLAAQEQGPGFVREAAGSIIIISGGGCGARERRLWRLFLRPPAHQCSLIAAAAGVKEPLLLALLMRSPVAVVVLRGEDGEKGNGKGEEVDGEGLSRGRRQSSWRCGDSRMMGSMMAGS